MIPITIAAQPSWHALSAGANLGIFAGYGDVLAEVAAELPIEDWQARGYVIVAAALNTTTRPQRMRLLPLVRTRLAEDRTAVRAMALEAFAILAAHEPTLCDEAMEMLEAARHNSEPAMRARARLMLPLLMRGECPGPTESCRVDGGRLSDVMATSPSPIARGAYATARPLAKRPRPALGGRRALPGNCDGSFGSHAG